MASELEQILTDIGLEQYLWTFQNAGFNDWQILCTITESELAALGVLRGHRRRLQRESKSYFQRLYAYLLMVCSCQEAAMAGPTRLASNQR